MSAIPLAAPQETIVRRAAGLFFGIATHLFFAVMVWYLFIFFSSTPGAPSAEWFWIDSALAIQFGVTHSLWLSIPVRKWLGQYITRSFYGCFFCVMTSLSLTLVFWQWRTVPIVVWQTSGIVAAIIWVGFIASWIGVFYSVSLTGLGYQTGLTEWLHWVRRIPLPPRTFTPRGAYLIMRHPVYLSFLGLLWFVPTMTLDHLLLSVIWSIYIFVGSWIKDHRLAYYLGDSYRDFARRMPGYPGMFFGPLGRWQADTHS